MGSSCENTEKKREGGKEEESLGKEEKRDLERVSRDGGRADPGGFNEFARARGGGTLEGRPENLRRDPSNG